jgi:hypothetical protein
MIGEMKSDRGGYDPGRGCDNWGNTVLGAIDLHSQLAGGHADPHDHAGTQTVLQCGWVAKV